MVVPLAFIFLQSYVVPFLVAHFLFSFSHCRRILYSSSQHIQIGNIFRCLSGCSSLNDDYICSFPSRKKYIKRCKEKERNNGRKTDRQEERKNDIAGQTQAGAEFLVQLVIGEIEASLLGFAHAPRQIVLDAGESQARPLLDVAPLGSGGSKVRC